MQLQCFHCSRVLEFSAERPSFCAYCGQALSETRKDAPVYSHSPLNDADLGISNGQDNADPQTVGGYRLLRALGAGGMGKVYEAEEITSGRRVALKLLTPQAAASREALERFRQEGRLASLIAHPRCVFVLAADEEAGRPYIVMELMTGTNLKDLVDKEGPLPPEEAVAKVLDVIEGLQEAHQRGVIHRDVKPSNCFLLPNGQVKIGDFGLSKSLVSDSHLTQSGAFLGTPLFASPEQIKGETIDFRTDVYAVAATLYYLLTGQAPFQRKNAAATMAGIVSEAPPPLRGLRPEVPPALEQVVLRGLQRDPVRRWQSLEAFRESLLPFVPGHLSFGAMRMRLGAFLIDIALFVAFWLVTDRLFSWLKEVTESDLARTAVSALGYLVNIAPWLLYFVVLEGRWRASLGKRLLRLRVYTADGSDAPGLRRAGVRALLFTVLFYLPWLVLNPNFEAGVTGSNVSWLVVQALGGLLLVAPMRAANGYRGLHEFLSGTRVVTLPPPEKRQPLERLHPDRQKHGLTRPRGMPATVGPFVVRGVRHHEIAEQILLAEDRALQRDVWLLLRPAMAAPVEGLRRELARPTRLRWVTGGRHGETQWDAFVAPAGCPLADLVDEQTTLPWREVRPLLQQLADELAAACADGTLPAVLTLERVWVQPSGRLQLLDFSLGKSTAPSDQPLAATQRALTLLGQAAVLALEGKPRPADEPPAPVRAPLPQHAARVLRRLLGVKQPYNQVAEFQTELAATRDLPTEITPALRAAHLGVLSLFLLPGLSLMLFARNIGSSMEVLNFIVQLFDLAKGKAEEYWQGTLGGAIIVWPTLWVLWAFLMRGGVSFSLMGISLVRSNGRKASRLQCAWRALLVWLPVTVLLYLSFALETAATRGAALIGWGLWGCALAILAGYVFMALESPTRSLHDRLSGTYLVPR